MVPFAGWELPVQYPTGPIREHHAVRQAAGLFDIDHMGQIEIRGPDAVPFLQRVQTWDVRTMAPQEAHYSLLCYADGGIVDDIFVYQLKERWWLVVNAANRSKDYAWLHAQAVEFNVTLTDISDETYMLALQGPRSKTILQRLTPTDLSQVPFHTSVETIVANIPTVVGATGYTGEYGYELFFPVNQAVTMWQALLEAGKPEGLIPCGLAARDSLRFEPCLPLYGHEISADVDPISARLSFFVSFDKGDFVGRNALLKIKLEGSSRKLVGFEMIDGGVPREGYRVTVEERTIGHVTTGMKSPTLNKFLGMAYVPPEYARAGTELQIVIRGKPKRARVVRRPFYVPAYRR